MKNEKVVQPKMANQFKHATINNIIYTKILQQKIGKKYCDAM